MKHSDAVRFVMDEVVDLLRVGSVGVYEFIEILNSDDAFEDLTPPAKVAVAHDALTALLNAPGRQLVWERWADNEFGQQPARLADLSDEAWLTPTERPYLNIAQI